MIVRGAAAVLEWSLSRRRRAWERVAQLPVLTQERTLLGLVSHGLLPGKRTSRGRGLPATGEDPPAPPPTTRCLPVTREALARVPGQRGVTPARVQGCPAHQSA
jgi:hypothetical protein